MERYTLELLKARVTSQTLRHREWLRKRQWKNYHLAKSLGFSATEAVILQNWKESTIRRLAEEREGELNAESKG